MVMVLTKKVEEETVKRATDDKTDIFSYLVLTATVCPSCGVYCNSYDELNDNELV